MRCLADFSQAGSRASMVSAGNLPRSRCRALTYRSRMSSLVALTPSERTKLGEWFPHLHATFRDGQLETAPRAIAILRLKPHPSEEEQGF